jgi:hypothetical protein
MTPRCPKCESSSFEVAPLKTGNGRRTFEVLQCSSCGLVVGVVGEPADASNQVSLLQRIVAKLGA